MRGEPAYSEARVESLKAKLGRLRDALNAADNEKARLREALEQVTANRDSLLLRVEETEDELDFVERDNARMTDEIAKLREQAEIDYQAAVAVAARYTELLEVVKDLGRLAYENGVRVGRTLDAELQDELTRLREEKQGLFTSDRNGFGPESPGFWAPATEGTGEEMAMLPQAELTKLRATVEELQLADTTNQRTIARLREELWKTTTAAAEEIADAEARYTKLLEAVKEMDRKLELAQKEMMDPAWDLYTLTFVASMIRDARQLLEDNG